VDSEHASLAQLLEGVEISSVEKLTLTASGGPFRGWSTEQLASVTVEQALAHPTWSMGGKISIDSATMMNKGLELIEAHHLFGFDYQNLDVVVHPQSIVHALVGLVDGMSLAHLGNPDMRSPIAWAIGYPDRPKLDIPRLDLGAVGRLEFEAPDEVTFKSLRLAREAGMAGGTAGCILNAANEVAVEAFLRSQIPFTAVADTVEATLERVESGRAFDFAAVQRADTEARTAASSLVAARLRR
jgi:1-deoxy-D-xylulose-5-phosphate reductoisomerase